MAKITSNKVTLVSTHGSVVPLAMFSLQVIMSQFLISDLFSDSENGFLFSHTRLGHSCEFYVSSFHLGAESNFQISTVNCRNFWRPLDVPLTTCLVPSSRSYLFRFFTICDFIVYSDFIGTHEQALTIAGSIKYWIVTCACAFVLQQYNTIGDNVDTMMMTHFRKVRQVYDVFLYLVCAAYIAGWN